MVQDSCSLFPWKMSDGNSEAEMPEEEDYALRSSRAAWGYLGPVWRTVMNNPAIFHSVPPRAALP